MKLSDEQYTPKSIFDALKITFDLDVAAPLGGSPHVPTKQFYTIEDDGLAQNWAGKVWLNPPYSMVTPWVDKFIENGNGIALLVVSRSKWFAKLWDSSDVIVNTSYNLKFDRPNGMKPNSISFQTFLFAMGNECSEALKNSGLGKAR